MSNFTMDLLFPSLQCWLQELTLVSRKARKANGLKLLFPNFSRTTFAYMNSCLNTITLPIFRQIQTKIYCQMESKENFTILEQNMLDRTLGSNNTMLATDNNLSSDQWMVGSSFSLQAENPPAISVSEALRTNGGD